MQDAEAVMKLKLSYEELGSQKQWPTSYEGPEILRHLPQRNTALQEECQRHVRTNNEIRQTVSRLDQQIEAQWQFLEGLKVWVTSSVATYLLHPLKFKPSLQLFVHTHSACVK